MPQPSTSPNPLAIERLASFDQWVTWKRVWRGNEATKPPFTTTWHAASTTKPATWTSYAAARKVVPTPGHDRGVGFVFTAHDPFVGIDLDGCRDPHTGQVAEWAQCLIAAIDSYVEISPSGTGVKLLAEGTLPQAGRKRELADVERVSYKTPAIEMYCAERYFTITADHLEGTPETIEPRQAVLDALFARYFADARAVVETSGVTSWATNDFTDDRVLETLFGMERGDEYRSLFEGDAEYGDDSAGDWRLACALAFVAGPDADQVERLLWRSGRVREKWLKHRTYLRKLTVERAIAHLEGGDGFYVGPGNSVPDFVIVAAQTEAESAATEAGSAAVEGEPSPTEPAPTEPAPTESTPTEPTTPTEAAPSQSAYLKPAERAAATADTWLDSYLAYGQSRTDAPAVFHEAIGMGVLAIAVGRKAGMELLQGPQYPTQFVLVVAPSTGYRKSTSLNYARDLIRDLGLADGRQHLTANEFTPQRIVQALSDLDGIALAFIRDEFSGFYDALNRLEFMAGGKDLLCLIYDGHPFRRQKMRTKSTPGASASSSTATTGAGGQGSGQATFVDPDADWDFVIDKPFLCILAATTPARFRQVAKLEDLSSGFLARFSIITPEPRGKSYVRKPIAPMTDAVRRARQDLLDFLIRLNSQDYTLEVDPDAMRRFDQYIHDLENETGQNDEDDDILAIVNERHAWMAFHVAQALAAGDPQAVAEGRLVRVLRLPHLYRALVVVEGWRQSSLKSLGKLAPSAFEQDFERVVELLRKFPRGFKNDDPNGLTRREIARKLRFAKQHMDQVEATLIDRGEVRRKKIGDKLYYERVM